MYIGFCMLAGLHGNLIAARWVAHWVGCDEQDKCFRRESFPGEGLHVADCFC